MGSASLIAETSYAGVHAQGLATAMSDLMTVQMLQLMFVQTCGY